MTPHPSKTTAIVAKLLDWFAANARDLPWRRTRDPYAIWVSEIMLQQTQVKTVIPFWERWLRELPTIVAVASTKSDRLHKLWEGLGYYTRVRNLQKAAQVIVQRHGGKFPEALADVLELPGIGRYTAGAICSIAFDQPTPILDGNVIRVLTRVFGIADHPKEKSTNARLWALAELLVVHAARIKEHEAEPNMSQSVRTSAATTAGNCSALNQSLMELGALICTPRNAQCSRCPVRKFCVALRENRVEALPNLGRRKPATTRRFAAFVLERDGKYLVRQRPAGAVNAHLWEFPNLELGQLVHGSPTTVAAAAEAVLGFVPHAFLPLVTVKHSITRYRITLEAFKVNPGRAGFRKTPGLWKTPAQMRQLAFTSAHRRILVASFPPRQSADFS